MSHISVEPKPIQTIYEWYRDDLLLVNRAYQRKLVWSIEQKQKLIDSILNLYPIPLILLAAKIDPDNGGETYEIIDGMQRLHCICSFIEQAFAIEDSNYFDLNEFSRASLEKKAGRFSGAPGHVQKIAPSQVSRILSYNLSVSIVRGADDARIREIFGRINSLGRVLSDQERRQSRAETSFARLVRLVATDIRGDVSADRLRLEQMPSISVDKSNAGYGVNASDTFWLRHGILRSKSLTRYPIS